MRVLLSIKPQFAERIFAGSKRFEFRKRIHRNPKVTTVVVYATKPVGKVIGEFTVLDIHTDSPKRLWRRTKAHSGIAAPAYDAYFEGKKLAFAIEVGKTQLYSRPLELRDVLPNGYAPQSFVYLPAVGPVANKR